MVKMVVKDENIVHALSAFARVKELVAEGIMLGVIPCPSCGCKLQFWTEGKKHHTRGRCPTADCLAWIE